jgi:2-hydroxy-6-oxonona-2,4-dienedioate hydrolase
MSVMEEIPLRVAGLQRFKAANGVAYKTLGHGRPLLLIHGSSGSWLHWYRNIEALAATHQVIAVDLPGYGESPDVPPDITLDAYVGMVVSAALEAAGSAPQMDVAAFSFGGLIGACVTAKLSERARRAVLLAPSGFPKPAYRPLGRRPRSTFAADEAGERDYLRHNLLAMMLYDVASADEEAIEIHAWNLARSRFSNQDFSHSNDLPKILAEIKCPLLIAYGDRDRTPYPSAEARIASCRQRVPTLESSVISGAGHWLQFEQPAQVNAMIEQFLGD